MADNPTKDTNLSPCKRATNSGRKYAHQHPNDVDVHKRALEILCNRPNYTKEEYEAYFQGYNNARLIDLLERMKETEYYNKMVAEQPTIVKAYHEYTQIEKLTQSDKKNMLAKISIIPPAYEQICKEASEIKKMKSADNGSTNIEKEVSAILEKVFNLGVHNGRLKFAFADTAVHLRGFTEKIFNEFWRGYQQGNKETSQQTPPLYKDYYPIPIISMGTENLSKKWKIAYERGYHYKSEKFTSIDIRKTYPNFDPNMYDYCVMGLLSSSRNSEKPINNANEMKNYVPYLHPDAFGNGTHEKLIPNTTTITHDNIVSAAALLMNLKDAPNKKRQSSPTYQNHDSKKSRNNDNDEDNDEDNDNYIDARYSTGLKKN